MVVDHTPGWSEQGADYLYIYPSTGNPIDSSATKRQRESMYDSDSTCGEDSENRRGVWGVTRTFHDFHNASSELLPNPEDVGPNLGPQDGPSRRVTDSLR